MRSTQLAAVCLATLSATALQPHLMGPANADWSPTRPVEFVVMAGQSGGADNIARFVADLIKKHNLLPVTVNVVNIPGRSGGEALSFLKNHSDTNHLLLFTLNSFFMAPLSQPELDIDILTFTPIARLGLDPFLLWVRADRADINSVSDFVAAAAKARNWTMAGTGSMSEDELLTIFLNSVYKLDIKYRAEGGGGEVARLLADGIVESTVNNPGEIYDYHIARRTKPLAAFTRDRLPQYANTPTFWELGVEFEYLMQRGVAGPPNMSQEAAQYYSSVFEKVFNSSEWQNYRERSGLVGEFLAGAQLRQYWHAQFSLHRMMLDVARDMRKK